MRKLKIADNVALVTCGRKTFTDKSKTYSEALWPNGRVDDLIRRGFLVVVEESTPTKESKPQAKTKKHVVTKADLKNDPSLKELGVKAGDEIDIPVEESTPTEEEESESEL